MSSYFFARAFSIALATVTLGSFGGCGAAKRGDEAVALPLALTPQGRHVGLLGFDGTTSTPTRNTTIYQFVQAAPIADKRYFAGTDMLATDFDRIVDEAVRYVCSVHDVRPFDALALLGYSRGGGAALRIAVRLQTACRTPVPIRWLGLLDACVTSVEETLIEGNSDRDFLATRCFHVTKTHDPKPFLGTASVLSCDRKTVDADHEGVGQSPLSLAYFNGDAASVMPELVGTTLPDVDSRTKACRANDTLLACFQAGCTWTNARCDAPSR